MYVKRVENVLLKAAVLAMAVFCTVVSGCGKSKTITPGDDSLQDISELKDESSGTVKKYHKWYYFNSHDFEEVDLPQDAPSHYKRAWTESIRISSMAPVPVRTSNSYFDSFAVVNRLGVLAINGNQIVLYEDKSIFQDDTADMLVFSNGVPVFYLYKNSFFNELVYDENGQTKGDIFQNDRPFLVEFNPSTKLCVPLVNYSNLNLNQNDQVTGFFWNGEKWACSVKTLEDKEHVNFTYFTWTPSINITELTPAISQDTFTFEQSSESDYRKLNTPYRFQDASQELKKLLSYVPKSFACYITWRDGSGTSPKKYYQEGNGDVPVNASAFISPNSGWLCAVFEDGTTYLKKSEGEDFMAFRLPRLPAGYKYGDATISRNQLIVAWEETDFYMTGRTGFITVDLNAEPFTKNLSAD